MYMYMSSFLLTISNYLKAIRESLHSVNQWGLNFINPLSIKTCLAQTNIAKQKQVTSQHSMKYTELRLVPHTCLLRKEICYTFFSC